MSELVSDINLLDILQVVISLLFTIILFFKTGDKKYLEEYMKTLIVRTDLGALNEKTQGQIFSRTKPVYRLDKATNTLELTDEVIDVQEIIDSCKEQTLNAVLERFFPQTALDENIVVLNNMQDDLDIVQNLTNKANDYKIKYNLDPKLSVKEVFDIVQTKSVELKEKIKTLEAQKNEKKEVE